MRSSIVPCLLLCAVLPRVLGTEGFEPLHHLGGNSPWFSGPNVFDISPDPPAGCTIDQAAFTSRHGSRYPDPGAYDQWTTLAAKIHASSFLTNTSELSFLSIWEPVLRDPVQEISMVSLIGYKELYDMGVAYRFTYPSLFTDNTNFTLWANDYTPAPRVVDSARLFARGYMGPNSTFGTVSVVKSTTSDSIANSLSPGDACPNYDDNGGGEPLSTWDNVYLPPIAARINSLLTGNLTFTTTDVSLFPYLCGFESQITGRRSPFCAIFTEEEYLQYEYAQDLRYYYGDGPGSGLEAKMMLPFLQDLVQRLVDGPNATYATAQGTTFTPNRLIATFTNDGPVAQLASAVGVFDGMPQLSGESMPANRTFISSNFVPMRGTVSLERLNCGSTGVFVRVKLNDAVYPVAGCQSGPGRSCALATYQAIVEDKVKAAGDFRENCGLNGTASNVTRVSFLQDPALPFEFSVQP